jgi:Homeodomain-like domain
MPVIVIQPLMQFVFASPLIILWAPLNQLSRKTRRNAVIDQIDCVFRHDAIAVFAHPRPNPALQFVDILVKLVREFLADSMNKLTKQARAQILHLLCEGQSIRAVTRLTGCSKNTVGEAVGWGRSRLRCISGQGTSQPALQARDPKHISSRAQQSHDADVRIDRMVLAGGDVSRRTGLRTT